METKHTKGIWGIYKSPTQVCITVDDNVSVASLPIKHPDCETIAKLIVEAGTVANETGKTPRQLADENKELLEALIEITGLLKFTSLSEKDTFRISYQSAINAINKATK